MAEPSAVQDGVRNLVDQIQQDASSYGNSIVKLWNECVASLKEKFEKQHAEQQAEQARDMRALQEQITVLRAENVAMKRKMEEGHAAIQRAQKRQRELLKDLSDTFDKEVE